MWSEEVKLDAQQRVTLPKNLLEFAGIDGKVAIIGMIDHIEFWNPEKFESYLQSLGTPSIQIPYSTNIWVAQLR